MKQVMMRVSLGLLVVAGLGRSALAATDDIVVGCTAATEVIHMNSDITVTEGTLSLDTPVLVAELPDGNFATTDGDDDLSIWSGTDRTLIDSIAADAGITALGVDQLYGRIAVGTSSGTVRIYDMSLTQVAFQAGFGGPIVDIAFQSDGSILLCTSVQLWRFNSSFTDILASQAGFPSIAGIAVLSDGKVAAADSVLSGGKVYVFTSDIVNVVALEQGYGAITDIAVQSDDSILIATPTTVWFRDSVLTGGGSQGGFSSITALAVQSDDEVVIGDSGTGKVYLMTSDMMNNAAPAQSGFSTINALAVLGITTPPELTDLDEDFEGDFLPSMWSQYTTTSTWVNRAAGHDGFGGDAGYAVELDDYNFSGGCGVTSARYKTEGLAAVGFDFCYRYGDEGVLYNANVDSDTSFYLNIAGGEIMYYAGDHWDYVTIPDAGYVRMTFDMTPGSWQRLVATRIDIFDNYILTVTDVTTGVTQTSNPFNAYISNPGSSSLNKMSWYTNPSTGLSTGFAIDNAFSEVSDPAATNVITLSGLGPNASGVATNTPLAQAFKIHYLPLGAGSVPDLGVWTDNYFPGYQYYVFNMDIAGGLDQYCDKISKAQNLEWSLNYNGGGFLHTLLGGTVTSFDYNGGDATALLECFTTVYTNGNVETYSTGAYQGYGNERCGELSESHYELAWDLATGTGTLTPTTPPAQTPGDANGDGAVDVGDLGILAANYGGTGKTWAEGDFNGDGNVDVGDLGILAANYGTGSSSADFDADYAKVFGEEADETVDAELPCAALGLPLIAGLFLMGLMLVKLED